MKVFLATFCAFSILSTFGQGNSEWKEGVVVLSDDRVLTGSISYPRGSDLIVLRTNDERTVLLAAKVQCFRYFDDVAEINRHFICLRDSKCYRFYEVVIEGPVNVLRSLKRFAGRSHIDEIESYDYFTWVDNRLERLIYFRSRVYPKLLKEKPQEIQAFCHEEQLNLNKMKSAILIIQEFNRINRKDVFVRAD
jgi:hypothetical protein